MSLPTQKHSLFEIPKSKCLRSSEIMVQLAHENTTETITLREILNKLGDRSFGLMLIIVCAFGMIPVVSLLTGMVAFIIGIQMILGFKKIKLPKYFLDKNLSSKKVNNALLLFAPKVEFLERFILPRWQFTQAHIFTRINGFIISILAIINAIPIPFTNVIPGLIIIIMGLGLIEKDGIVQFLSVCLSLASLVLLFGFVF